MIKIWQRYFIYETIKTCFSVMGVFYGLYILIDYANHAASFHRFGALAWEKVFVYYFHEFFRRLDVILPFSLMIATIRALCSFNVYNELVALVTSGVSFKRLLTPFIFLGLLGTMILYVNIQFIQPEALNALRRFETQRAILKQKNKAKSIAGTQLLELPDQTRLIFQSYDEEEKRFFDLFWIRSVDDIYRIKYLYLNEPDGLPYGEYVDHLMRNKEGRLVVKESAFKTLFPQIVLQQGALAHTKLLPEEQSLSQLWQAQRKQTQSTFNNDQEVQEVASFYYKLLMPWLALLVVLAPASFCIRTRRDLPLFFLYATAIFCFIAFNLAMSAAYLLAKRFIIPPALGLMIPFFLASSFCFWSFKRA